VDSAYLDELHVADRVPVWEAMAKQPEESSV
jgi:hypothetical protein